MEPQDTRGEERLMLIFRDIYMDELYQPFSSLSRGRAKESLNFHHICVQGTGLRILLFHTQQWTELAVTHHLKNKKPLRISLMWFLCQDATSLYFLGETYTSEFFPRVLNQNSYRPCRSSLKPPLYLDTLSSKSPKRSTHFILFGVYHFCHMAALLWVSDISKWRQRAHPPFLFLFLHNAHLQIAVSLQLRTPAYNPLGHHHGNWKEILKPNLRMDYMKH